MRKLWICAAMLAACGGGSGGPSLLVEVSALDALAEAGGAVSFEVRALNADGTHAAAFAGTVHLSSSDPKAVFDREPRLADGRAIVDVEFRTAGLQALVASLGARNASATIRVDPGPAASFLVTVTDGQPLGKGLPMAGNVTATAADAFGNVAPGFSAATDPVTVRAEPASVEVGGLAGPDANMLADAADFVDGTAALEGRVVLRGVAQSARLVLESAGGVSGVSEPFSIDALGPVPAAAARLFDVNRNGVVDAGDDLLLAFDEEIVVDGATAADFALSEPGDALGAGAAVAPGPSPDEVRITLGAGATLRPAGLASGITALASGAITSAATGAPVEETDPADVVPFPVEGPTFTNAGDLRGVASGDFDGDGDLDLAVAASYGAGRVFLNDGSGQFAQHAVLAIADGQGRLAPGDVDGDGDLDLVLADYLGARVFKNDGAGAFADAGAARAPVGVDLRWVMDVALGDLDNDGDLDLVLPCGYVDQAVFLNDGLGAFAYRDSIGRGYCARAALHDFDGDGFLDVVLATVVAGPNGVETNAVDEVWRNDGTARFTKLTDYGLVQRTWGLAIGDVDGDGDVDIVAGDQDDLRVYRNGGAGASFSLAATLDSRTFPHEVRLADLDGDGHLDVLSTRGFWMNEGDGRTFRFVAEVTPTPRGRGSIATGDFDGDGRLDVVVVNTSVLGQSGSPSIVYYGSTALE